MKNTSTERLPWLRYVVSCILSVVVVALTIALPGCAQKEVPVEPEIPAHYTTYTDEVGLFSISYPPDWEPALSLIEGLEEAVKDIVTSIESDAPVEKASAIFFAGLPSETGYMPNVNIGVESLSGIVWTHDNMVEAEIRGLKKFIQDYHELSRVKTTVDGREATIVEYEGTFPQLGKAHWLQTFILVGKSAWIVTCAALPGKFSKWEDDFHAIVRSLRILK